MTKKEIIEIINTSQKLQILKESNLEDYNYIKNVILEKNKNKRA